MSTTCSFVRCRRRRCRSKIPGQLARSDADDRCRSAGLCRRLLVHEKQLRLRSSRLLIRPSIVESARVHSSSSIERARGTELGQHPQIGKVGRSVLLHAMPAGHWTAARNRRALLRSQLPFSPASNVTGPAIRHNDMSVAPRCTGCVADGFASVFPPGD